MRVLLIGVGTVGESIARLSASHDWCEAMVLADYDVARARTLADSPGRHGALPGHPDRRPQPRGGDRGGPRPPRGPGHERRRPAVRDARVQRRARRRCELHGHGHEPVPAASRPTRSEVPGVKLGDEQFAHGRRVGERAAGWRWWGWAWTRDCRTSSPRTPPSTTVRRGPRGPRPRRRRPRDPGFAFAPVFSIWTTIEECLNPPIVWADGDWHTTEPFSGPERFPFPEGIGPVECVNVEHEEVLLVPRWIMTQQRHLQVRARGRLHRQAQDDSRPRAWIAPTRSPSRASRSRRATCSRPSRPTRSASATSSAAGPWSGPG